MKNVIYILFLTLVLGACSSDEGIAKDEEKPTITINYTNGFPKACAQLERGKTYIFKAQTTDNQALASYSLDIHHNFDHHTHDDQDVVCTLDPKKSAIDPFIFMENYQLEGGLTTFEINIELSIPDDIDTGDYHCSYAVTDQTGWQSRTSIDIKIVE